VKCRLFLVLVSLHKGCKKSCSPECSINNQAKGSAAPCSSNCLCQRLAFLGNSGCLTCLLATFSSVSLVSQPLPLVEIRPSPKLHLAKPLHSICLGFAERHSCVQPGLLPFQFSGGGNFMLLIAAGQSGGPCSEGFGLQPCARCGAVAA